MEGPGRLGPLQDRPPGAADQVPGESLGEASAGVAVAGRLGGDGGEPLVVAGLLEAIDGLVAGVVVGEDPGEEHPEGDPGGVGAVAPGVVELTAHVLDEGAGEEVEEGGSLLLLELASDGIDLV